MQIALTEIERQLLTEMLNIELRDLRSENYHAESHETKELLKRREAVVRGLLERLDASRASEPQAATQAN